MMKKVISVILWGKDILVGILNMMKELEPLVPEFKKEILFLKVNIQILIVKRILYKTVMISYILTIITQ